VLLKVLGLSLLLIALILGVIMVAVDLKQAEPEIDFFYGPTSVGYDGRYVYFMLGFRTPFYLESPQVRASMYSIALRAEYPGGAYVTGARISPLELSECTLYLVYDFLKANTLEQRYPISSMMGHFFENPLFSSRDINIALSEVSRLAEERVSRPARGGSCNLTIGLDSIPRLVFFVARAPADKVSVVDNQGRVYTGEEARKILEESVGFPYLFLPVYNASPAPSPAPAGPTPTPVPVTVTFTRPTATIVVSSSGYRLTSTTNGIIGEALSLRIVSTIEPGLYEYWRLSSIVLAGLAILVYDSTRNPGAYEGRRYAWLRWIASILGTLRGSRGQRGRR